MELVRFPSRGGFSVRSIIAFALTVVATALLWVVFSSSPTHAADTATWSGTSTILYANHGYMKATDVTDTTGTIPAGSTIYKAPLQTVTNSSTQKLLVLYFAPGVDPPTATSVNYVEFDVQGGQISHPQNKQSVSLTAQGKETDDKKSSCSVSGIGWIICPVSVFLADAMDNLFSILASMIAVQPTVLGDANNSMYIAWNIMRTIANVAFVIVFLIIIYSQLTNMGVSNYGLKKLVPRLIIAAILVNVSFYIAALAIDISNVAGYSIQQIFEGIRKGVFHITNDNLSGFNTNAWGAVTTAVLAGGGLIGGVYYMASGGLYLLIPLLLGLALTVLFVVIVLAARQAIILILVIIAPLAFVANLLPNTEKWFDKWRELFMTMLIFFPAFSLVFGGSQLAGQIIMQNAGDNVVTLIFGMAVQIAPLVITPLLLRLSGSLLGKIAQIANNPRKGLIDRNRNWAQRRAEHAKQKNMALGPRLKNPASLGAGMVRRMDYRKRRLEDNTEAYKQAATNRYESTPKYAKIHELKAGYDIDKESIHSAHTAHLEHLKITPGSSLYDRAHNAEANKDRATAAQNLTNAHFNRQRVLGGNAMNAAELNLHNASYELEMSKERLQADEAAKNIYYNNERVRLGSRLYNNAYDAEVNKSGLEASEAAKNAFYTNQRATAGTRLNATVDPLETSKARLEGAQSRYAAVVDELKLNPNATLHGAIQTAQSAKQQAEAAQIKLQTFFDEQNLTPGSVLNGSYVELERAKIIGEGSKADLARYAADLKSKDGTLHIEHIRTENFKQAQQVSEARITRIVDEYKAGGIKDAAGNTLIDGKLVSDAEQALVDTMLSNAIDLTAESQGSTNAKSIQSRRIAEAFTETVEDADGNKVPTSRAEELLTIAQSINPDGKIRAQASATATLSKLQKESLEDNMVLINYEARQDPRGIRGVDLAKEIINKANDPDERVRAEVSPTQFEAALQMRIDDGQTLDFEDMRASMDVDQTIIDRVIERNRGAFKGKGGFHLQADLGLSLQRYFEKFDEGKLEYYDLETHSMKPVTDRSQVENVFRTDMKRQRLGTLSNTNADGLGGIKFSTFADTADHLAEWYDLMDTTGTGKQADEDRATVARIHGLLQNALSDPNLRGTMNDRTDQAHEMDAFLSEKLGRQPIPRPEAERATEPGIPPRPATGADSAPNIDPSEGSPSEANNDDNNQ